MKVTVQKRIFSPIKTKHFQATKDAVKLYIRSAFSHLTQDITG